VLLNILANGIIVGSVYALVALGLTLVFGVLEIPDFNQGGIFMLGAFVVYFAVESWGLHYIPAVVVGAAVCGVVGVLIGDVIYQRLMSSPHSFLLIAALGLFLISQNTAQYVWGPAPRRVNTDFSGRTVELLGVVFTWERLIAFGVTVLAIVLLQLFLKKTRYGKALRATAEDRPVAALMGIDPKMMGRLTMFIASSFSGLAGGLLAPLLFVFPAMGAEIILKAFVIVVLGGLGSIPGAIVGAWLLGISESFGSYYFGAAWKNSTAFLVLIVVLLIRPRGLFNVTTEKI
jgi:branched-chain amino acid transport system permease protein